MGTEFQLIPDSASTFAQAIDANYYYIWAITIFFTIGIVAVVTYFSLRYRRAHKDEDVEVCAKPRHMLDERQPTQVGGHLGPGVLLNGQRDICRCPQTCALGVDLGGETGDHSVGHQTTHARVGAGSRYVDALGQ